jgi:hypothetical protein
MSQETTNRPTPATIADLFKQYLGGQVAARAEGLGLELPDGEVTPFDVVPVQPVDPKQAWEDALAAVRMFPGVEARSWPVPAEWPVLVHGQEPALAMAFSVGNYPQLVRNLQPLLAGDDVTGLRADSARANAPAGLIEWTSTVKEPAELVIAAGALRLAHHFDDAERLLKRVTAAPWKDLLDNEKAALAWHRGQFEAAAKAWQSQKPTAPVLFNRGMAALFLGDSKARNSLNEAVKLLPDTGAWHHLGRLYLALADARRS